MTSSQRFVRSTLPRISGPQVDERTRFDVRPEAVAAGTGLNRSSVGNVILHRTAGYFAINARI
jgi:hypothetical protein